MPFARQLKEWAGGVNLLQLRAFLYSPMDRGKY